MATETEKALLTDANGNVLPQYWDATNSRYVVESTGDASAVDFTETVLLTDPNGHVIPQIWDATNSRWTAKTSSGGGGGGTGPQGPAGKDGKSAYQVALDNGFVGSEEVWLESLVGPAGPQGEPGVDGKSFTYDDFTAEQLEALRGPEGPPGADATLILPLSADDVTDSTSRVLIHPDERAQITANTTEIQSHSTRLKTVEDTIATSSTTDEKVKMNASDIVGYLEDKLDGATIANVGGKLVVVSINGLDVSTVELNLLAGARSPIQAQLDAITSITGSKEIVETELDLPVEVPENGTVLVRQDSSHENKSTFYVSNGTTWEFVGEIESGFARDFTINPINLETETTGILPKARYEKPLASEITVTDSANNFVGKNVEVILAELFQYADNTKTSWDSVVGLGLNKNNTAQEFTDATYALLVKFANNLTLKGVNAHPSNRLEEMIDKIPGIPNVSISGTIKKTSKIDVVAPYELEITLNDALALNDIATTAIEFIPGESDVVHYISEFDNNDASNFIFDEFVEFDGVMKLKSNLYLNMIDDTDWLEDGHFSYTEIDVTLYDSVQGVE